MTKSAVLTSILSLILSNGTCEVIHVPDRDEPLVEDAFQRFASSRKVEGYFAVTFSIGDHRCVNLRPKPRTLGPSPVYCYDKQGAFLEVHGLEQ